MVKLVKSENPDGTATVKVAKGSKTVTSKGKTATGGKIVGKLPKKRPQVEDLDLGLDLEDEDFTTPLDEDVSHYDEILDTKPATKNSHIYVTADGIVGDVEYDSLQIIDTTGLNEDALNDLAYVSREERESLADSLRVKSPYMSQHYFNSTGEYGPVEQLKILNTSDLTKSELNRIYSSDEPFYEVNNYEVQSYKVLTSENSRDDVRNNTLMSKSLTY